MRETISTTKLIDSDLYAKIDLLINMGKFESAEKLVRTALAETNSADLQSLLGHTLQSQGRQGEAEAAYRQALEMQPEHVEATMILAAILCDTSQYNQAQKTFSKIESQIDPDWQTPKHTLKLLANKHLELAKYYGELYLWENAEEEAQKALSLAKNEEAIRLALAKYTIMAGKPDEALMILGAMAANEKYNKQIKILQGLAYAKLDNLKAAADYWDTPHPQA